MRCIEPHKNAASCLEKKTWKYPPPTKQQLYGNLPLISQTIQIRRTRHLGRSWRSKDELISDVLLRTRAHGRASVEIYKAFCLDVAQGHMKGTPNETRTHSCRFASRGRLAKTYISSVQTQDTAYKTFQKWWMIGMDGEWENNSVLSAWLDDHNESNNRMKDKLNFCLNFYMTKCINPLFKHIYIYPTLGRSPWCNG